MTLDFGFMKETFLALLAGIPVTLQLTFVTLLVSCPVAFFLALWRMRTKTVRSKFVSLYISFVRGTPIVLQILFLYSLLPTVLNYLLKEVLHTQINIFSVNPILYAYIVFVLNTAAILTEVFRAALETVNHGQMEAAIAIGLSKRQAYTRIILPQAIVAALPNICNATVNLLKSTSLAFMMTVQDITAIAKTQAAFGYNYIESYLDIFFVYIILCTAVQLIFSGIERYAAGYKKPGNRKKRDIVHSRKQEVASHVEYS